MKFLSAVLVLFAAGCATLPMLKKPATVASPIVVSGRPIPYPIIESKGFARAVANGTRTRTGEPGPKYWQQYSRYKIDAELVPASNQLTGRETVRYYNRSPDTLRTPRFFLNQNLFKPNAAR